MEDSNSKNIEAFVTTALAHQVSIAAALALSVRNDPNAKELLDRIEADLIASSIWKLGNSNAPASYGENYRQKVSELFRLARARISSSN
ncbi:hypothetical protein WCQ02_34930 [Paraburkholderia tropica]|uniref:Uncharacterized protein n=1 Tax=Paraburkholderia tropica TaxID=92647 RepID=A0ABX5MMW5_9BURK|nr:hypothetical protein [Paraburkholderia tropica]PXX14488.1 hypothetical protein C7400_11298 [Paraburkholderia tropica]PZW79553.1 hypothetical protein C7399_11297 [Paraburkholderia tropica]